MICTKCNIDKPLDQYATYYHSTQNKIRIRKYCKQCYGEQQKLIKQKRKMENQLDPTKNKICNVCNVLKPLEDFYSNLTRGKRYYQNRCRICTNKVHHERSIEYKLKMQRGSERVCTHPNQYPDDMQRKQVFGVMDRLGYLFNEEMGIWLKEGIKELRDGQIFFPKVRPKRKIR